STQGRTRRRCRTWTASPAASARSATPAAAAGSAAASAPRTEHPGLSTPARTGPPGTRASEERHALTAVRRHGVRHRVALDQVQRVEPLAQLTRLGVPEPHPVTDQQVVRGGAQQRRLHLTGTLLRVV